MTQEETRMRVINTIQSVVSDFGMDYRYPDEEKHDGCRYVVRGEDGDLRASCLVGQVLQRLGVDLATLADYEGESASSVVRHLVAGGEHDNLLESALNFAQQVQDEGQPWGYALQVFFERLARSQWVEG